MTSIAFFNNKGGVGKAMAHTARKPVFHLRAADGALGAHATAAQRAGADFRALAARIAAQVGMPLPTPGR